MHTDPGAVVMDESQLPEFIHKKVDATSCCTYQLREGFLGYFRDKDFGLPGFTVSGEDQ